ncbi:MAG: hypothetical protein R3F41_00415 [Gammaproteobacteria bacterium]|nr:hypothetical protein [Pseudomonadales bacterium]
MLTFFKRLFITLLTVLLVVVIFLVGMRFHDGPLEIISGGPFRSGELSPAPDDWSFLQDRQTIQFQTLTPARSRTVWLAVYDGRLFVVSGYMTTGYGALWKQWPHYIEEDDRVILRIDGRLYEQRLERITSGPAIEPVLAELSRKYGDGLGLGAVEVTEGHTWMYEVVER